MKSERTGTVEAWVLQVCGSVNQGSLPLRSASAKVWESERTTAHFTVSALNIKMHASHAQNFVKTSELI
jgi:hypothetical protein